MQEECSDDPYTPKLATEMYDIAQTKIQACINEDERNETPDGKIPESHDAANSKWREFMRPWESVNPLLSFRQVVETYPRQKPFKEEVDEFMNNNEMEEVLAQLFTTIGSVATYDSINAKFSSSKSIHRQMTKQIERSVW